MGGLLPSWTDFDAYLTCNVQATQRLLEAARATGSVARLVHASTSSVYGADVAGDEATPCAPVSPYGVTKLAAEHLVRAYDAQFGLPATILRFFSVYGPRQRPDMGYYKFVEGLLSGRPVTVFGDGEQRRGNTYVADAARAVLLAAERFRRGAVYNVGGGEEVSANEALALLEGLTGRRAEVRAGAGPAGRAASHAGGHHAGPGRSWAGPPPPPCGRGSPPRWPGSGSCTGRRSGPASAGLRRPPSGPSLAGLGPQVVGVIGEGLVDVAHVAEGLGEHGRHVDVVDGVVDLIAVAVVAHQAPVTQEAQVVRGGGLRQPHAGGHVPHRELVPDEHGHDLGPGGIGQGAERLRRAAHQVPRVGQGDLVRAHRRRGRVRGVRIERGTDGLLSDSAKGVRLQRGGLLHGVRLRSAPHAPSLRAPLLRA